MGRKAFDLSARSKAYGGRVAEIRTMNSKFYLPISITPYYIPTRSLS